ncbi:MAG: hypothetical protein ABW217_23175 [Polyangiaceae bacterium]
MKILMEEGAVFPLTRKYVAEKRSVRPGVLAVLLIVAGCSTTEKTAPPVDAPDSSFPIEPGGGDDGGSMRVEDDAAAGDVIEAYSGTLGVTAGCDLGFLEDGDLTTVPEFFSAFRYTEESSCESPDREFLLWNSSEASVEILGVSVDDPAFSMARASLPSHWQRAIPGRSACVTSERRLEAFR